MHGIVISDKVTTKWAGRTKEHYIGLGYEYTRQGDSFNVKVDDLLPCSHVKVLVKCPVCEEQRYTKWFRVSNKDNTLCQKCGASMANVKKLVTGDRFDRLTVIGISVRRGNSGQYYYDCECDCGGSITTQRHSLVSGLTRSCGCLQRESASNIASSMVGPLNPMWDESLSDEDRADRKRMYTAEYRHWRDLVIERDRGMCVCCGEEECLCVHHILPYREYVDLRTDVDNGLTLCERCHNEFHSVYGKTEFDQMDLINFVMDYGK